MKTTLWLLIEAIVVVVANSGAPEAAAELRYVFEINRHGARSGLKNADGFPVIEGMLTPVGMRQRYLLGRYNKQRYMENKSSPYL